MKAFILFGKPTARSAVSLFYGLSGRIPPPCFGFSERLFSAKFLFQFFIWIQYKFKEIYQFRDQYAKEWNLDLRIHKNEAADGLNAFPTNDRLLCCTQRKTEALKDLVRQNGYQALILGIRRDEHGIRAKERFFSTRDEDFEWDYKHQAPEMWNHFKTDVGPAEHIRIHPLLSWTEIDIWRYIQREKIPVCELYFSRNHKRYRSIGCEPCCQPVASDASTIEQIIMELETTHVSERSGRAQDKESDYMMQKLRSLGYM